MKLANINRDLLTVRDKITRHLDDKETNKLTTNNDNTDPYDTKVSDKDQDLQVTKNLIGLLYDFKGKKHKKQRKTTFHCPNNMEDFTVRLTLLLRQNSEGYDGL